MRRRLIIWLGLPLLVLVLLVFAAKSWLLHSDSGARWVISYISTQMGDDLSIGEVSGNLDTGLTLKQIVYRQDTLDVKVGRAEANGEISLFPVRVAIESLHAFDVEIRTLPGKTEAPSRSDSLEDILGSLSLPIELDMQNLQITRLKVIDAANELLFKLNKAELSFNWKESFTLNNLNVDSEHFSAGLKGSIQLQSPFTHQLSLSAVIAAADTTDVQTPEDIRIEASTQGNEKNSTIEIVSFEPAIKLNGDIIRPLDNARFDLHISLQEHLFSGASQGPGILISDVAGKLEGLPTNYSLQLSATVNVSGYPPARLSLAGEGDLASMNISNLNLAAEFVDANASGKIGWAEQLSFDLNVELQRLLPSLWIADWPDQHFVHGQISAVSEDSLIRVSGLDVKVTGTPFEVAGQALIDPAGNHVDASLKWKSIGWPIWQQPYQVSSDNGELQVAGELDDWRFSGAMDLQTPEYPGGVFELDGHGSSETAAVNIVRGQALGGTLAGDALLDWSGPLNWNARLNVAKLDLAAIISDLPARLDASVEVFQNAGSESFELNFKQLHANLGGTFKGQSVDGSGKVVYDSSGLGFEGLQIHSERSKLLLQGNPGSSQGVEFALEVHGPDWVSTFLGGEISGQGRIALASSQPVIDVNLVATGMNWGDWALERLAVSPINVGGAPGIDLGIDIENLSSGNTTVQSGRIELTGDKDRQSLSILLNQGEYEFQSALSGALSSWSSLTGLSWSGLLDDTRVRLRDEELLSQTSPAAIAFSPQSVNFQQVCMSTVGAGGLCVQTDWSSDGQLAIEARLSAIPLSISELLFDHGIKFTQTIGGEFKWQRSATQNPSGHLALNISAGQFGDELEVYEAVKTGEGFLGFDLDNGNLTAGELKVPFPGVGLIDVDYSVSGLLLDGTGKVEGDVKIDLNDISVVEGLIPELENFSGQLSSNLKLSGVTSDPHLDGHVSLLNAGVDIPFVGTQLREISLEGQVSSRDRAMLKGGFKAGEGVGQLELNSSFSDWGSPELTLKVTGEGLRVLNTPDVRVDANTDVSLAWGSDGWIIDGWVLIPDAKITPVTLDLDKVSESEDVEIVQGELPYGGNDNEEDDVVRLNGKLKVSLGEKVRVETDLAKARLTGDVDLAWKDNLIPVADGAIHVNGTVSVFGPRLTLHDSQIRFPGVPVDTPVLDVRADRDIFGNTQIRTAGVSVTGTAKRPVIDAYTVPATNSDRAWALLITGNDVDYGQSVGAFEVGTYIAPKLYLSYGISLFDDGNVVSARYDLKRGFGIKASSGQSESGVDVSYTIDR